MAFTKAQTLFLESKSAMMFNGMWLQNEMAATAGKNTNISMMKMPVISSIINKCNTINSDSELSSVVEKVDKVSSGEETVTLTNNDADLIVINDSLSVSQNDWKRIYEARNIASSNANEHYVAISKHTNVKEAAQEFVKYFYSDEAMQTYVDTTHFSLPFAEFSDNRDVDTTGWSLFEKQLKIINEQVAPINARNLKTSDMFLLGGADFLAGENITALCAKGTAHDTADGIWSKVTTNIEQKWNDWMENAGFTK